MVTDESIFQPANGFPDSALQFVHDDLVFSSPLNRRSIFCANGQGTRILNVSGCLNLKAVTFKQPVVKFASQQCENVLICAGCGI